MAESQRTAGMPQRLWRPFLTGLLIVAVFQCRAARAADAGDVRWLVQYDGQKLPADPWTLHGTGQTEIVAGGLHIVDNSADECCYRAAWKADPALEIVVEARVKMGGVVGSRGKESIWPWRDGAPAGLLVSDGRRQEGLVLMPRGVRTFTDRFCELNTTGGFHDYRLIIRGSDMSVEVDGVRRIVGQNAFWKAAAAPEPFIQFGSSSKPFTGDAVWQYVRLGVRPPTSVAEPARLKVTVSEPWEITRADKVRHTRPYLYDMGQGLLLMSVAQGPDAYYEPYGVLKSTDGGLTWRPIPGLDQKEYAPQPMIRLADGTILGVSRWSHLQGDVLVGRTVHFDARAETYRIVENRIALPEGATAGDGKGVLVFDRHIFAEPDGSVLAVVYGHLGSARGAWLMKSTDRGVTWHPFSMIGTGAEPGVARTSAGAMTAVLRQSSMLPLLQVWSSDGGRTWSKPVTLEEGSVDPDVQMLSSGVLACSYGRPASCLMFSLDRGKTWTAHHVVSDKTGFNYTTIREIHPGRLLYVHDAPSLRAVYVDVERIVP